MVIQTPNGPVTFPDDMPPEEIERVLQQQFGGPQNEIDPEQRNQIGREELGDPIEAALIGAGRFFTELGQGVKQKYLMASDKEKAQAYTEKLNKERQRWDELTAGAGMEDVGYYGSMMLPAVIPGGGIARTAGLGGLETGVMPTQEAEWSDVAAQAALGAGTAGAVRAAPDLYRANKARRQRNKLESIDPDVAAFTAQHGVNVGPDVYAPTLARTAARETLDVPIVGRPGGRGMREDADRVMAELAEANRADDGIQDAFVTGKKRFDDQISATWNAANKQVGDAPISTGNLNRAFYDLRKDLLADPKISRESVNQIEDMWKRRGTMRTVEELHDFRKQFSAKVSNLFRDEGVRSIAPNRFYGVITEELQDSVAKSYGRAGLDVWQNAVDTTKELKRIPRNARIMKAAAQGDIDAEKPFINVALGQDRNRREALKQVIGEQGLPAVRNEVITDIMGVYKNKGVSAASKRIGALDDTITDFFGPDEAAALRGFGKFLDSVPNKDNFLRSAVFSGGGLGGLTAMGGLPTAITGYAGLATALRRRDVQAMLQKLSTAPKDSRLAQELSKYIGLALAGETAQPEPLQVPIQDGRRVAK